MAVTQAQTLDTWLSSGITESHYDKTSWLSYTTKQQHPGNGVSVGLTEALAAKRFSVAKTPHSYDPAGLAKVCASKVYSLTPNMRQAYAAVDAAGDTITGARSLDRDRLLPTS